MDLIRFLGLVKGWGWRWRWWRVVRGLDWKVLERDERLRLRLILRI
jgi:hypothetical protein